MDKNPGLVAHGVYCLTVPQPAAEPNNVYFIEDELPTLVDAGHSHPATVRALKDLLKELGYSWRDIRQVIYTHPHTDHMGGGVYINENYSIRQVGYRTANKKAWDYGFYLRGWQTMDISLGTKYPELLEQLRSDRSNVFVNVDYPTKGVIRLDLEVDEGDVVSLGKRSLRVLYTPGHNPYHISLYEPEQKLLFSGDFLVSKGPALTAISGGDVFLYKATLLRLKEKLDGGLEVKKVFPGHGPVLYDAYAAIEGCLGTLEKHKERVLKILACGSKSITGITNDFFSGSENRYFLGLKIAIIDNLLDWLCAEGLIGYTELDGVRWFYLKV